MGDDVFFESGFAPPEPMRPPPGRMQQQQGFFSEGFGGPGNAAPPPPIYAQQAPIAVDASFGGMAAPEMAGGHGAGEDFGGDNSGRKINLFTGTYEGEEPLLDVLGISFDHIRRKAVIALNPVQKVTEEDVNDRDLAGPLVFCLLLGSFLLMAGKIHFGYVYGVGMIGCLSMYFLLNVMSQTPADVYCTTSVLGYCLLPMVLLAGIAVLVPLYGLFGLLLSLSVVLWCAHSATSMFVVLLRSRDQHLLILYPTVLVYASFALLAIF